VTCVLFGQFSKVDAPPADRWIFVGRNVYQDSFLSKEEAGSLSFTSCLSLVY
jgi:hypothetical protein